MGRMKRFIKKYSFTWIVFVYAAVYFRWFAWLEEHVTGEYSVIHMKIDDMIPFIEFFALPYILWFVYIVLAVALCIIADKESFYRAFLFLATGMTVFLLVSTFFPNGHHLRPLVFERDNIFVSLVRLIYKSDTATNLFPSIHVYNSLGCHFALMNTPGLKEKRWLKNSSLVTCILIILSTVFIKQHSVFDVITAFALSAVMYPISWKIDYQTIFAERRARREEKKAHARA